MMTVNAKWITCVHCGTESLACTTLVQKGCCFSCYMKGYTGDVFIPGEPA